MALKLVLNPITGKFDLVQGVDPLNVGAIQFDTAHTSLPNAEGLLQWNATDGTLDLGMSDGDITMQVGQELFMKVRNVSGTLIANGKPVYVSGRTGNRPNIYLSRSDSETTSGVIGLTTQDIDSPADGFVTTQGYVRGIKTDYTGTGNWGTTWASSDKLYISKTIAGQLTNVEPSAPHHSDVVATVEIVHSNLGSLLVNIEKHKTLEELTDVNGTALSTTGQIPVWNQTAGYFDFNKNLVTEYVPYTGATADVDLGTHILTASRIDVTNGGLTASLKTDGAYNLIVGNGGDSLDGGSFNTAIGSLSLNAVDTGSDNIALGFFALGVLTDGVGNTAIGANSLANSFNAL